MVLDETELAKAAKEAEKIILQHVNEKDDHVFSVAFEKKMKRLFKREKYHRAHYFKKRLAIALIIVCITGGLTVSVEAVRSSVIAFITEVFEKFTSVTYQKDEDLSSQAPVYLMEYIPAGFILEEKEEIFNDLHYRYKNEIGQEILFHQVEIEGNKMVIDTEDTQLEAFWLEGHQLYYYENKRVKNLMWLQGSYQFMISSELEKDELIKMYLSMK